MKQPRSPGLFAMRLPSIVRALGCPLRGVWHARLEFSPDLWERSSDGIFAADADNKIIFWNRAAAAILGYTREQACALTVDQLWVTEEAAVPYPSAEVPERLLRHRNGGALYVEMTSDARSDPVRQIEYVLYSFRDITALKVAHIVSFLRGKYGDCFEATPDAFLIINITGNIVLVNSKAEQLFGHRASDLLGQPAQMLMPAGERGKHHAHSGFEGQPRLQTMREDANLFALRKDGSMFPVEVTLSPLQTEAGALVCSAIRDSTHRRQHEQRLREPSRLENEFLASMSHELRTPLNGILGFTEFILDEKPGPLNQKQKEYLGDVLTSGRDLLQLINDILDLSRIEAGRIVPNPESFRLPAALNEVMAPISQSALDKNLALIVDVADSEVMLDRSLLIQVLYNLISNAVKFTERGEVRIKLSLGQHHDCLVVEVSDTGTGIHADNIDSLFVYFQQLDAGSTRRHGGTGLGLVLTKKIVELQKGSIAVSSEQGIGSTFTVTLPLEANG